MMKDRKQCALTPYLLWAFLIAWALQIAAGLMYRRGNGMVYTALLSLSMFAPMLAAGISRRRTFLIALATGLVEVLGTLFGYFAVSVASFLLPFFLAFAGGTMLYVISNDMIPETHQHGYERAATYALLLGFIVMLVMDFYIG